MSWSSKWPEPKSITGIDYGSDEKSIETLIQNGKIINQYETRTIEVKHNNKKIIVEVTVVGDLALDFDENGWNIYHIPTLACFDKAVPGSQGGCAELQFTYDKLPLLNWMTKVQQSYCERNHTEMVP